ncbi:hypothetical protein Acr_21g0009760 [Actinidia rufa]|uniref:Uncharacterized protein n=1 Tax=Actinidia rufa TaxID=165716 RepID=A0A7J0GHU3_9ERIC|nr:hypothetical protein Acr_21g0009760 [Actinidia rufa]
MDHGEILGRMSMERYLGDVGDKLERLPSGDLEMEIPSTLPRPMARRRQYFGSGRSDEYSEGGYGELNGDDLARFHGLVLPRSRGFGDVKFGVLNATGLRRMNVRRCSVPLRARLKLSDLAKVVAQKAATSASKGVVISEGSETTSGKRPLDDGSKGKQVAQSPEPKKARIDTGASRAPAKPPVASGAGSSAHRTLGEALGPQASVMASAATAEKILAGVILPADKEKVDKLTFDQVVTKFIHALGQGVILGSSLAVRSRDFAESALNQKAVAESAEMEMVRAQNRAIELKGALAEEKAKGKKLAEDADARSKVIAKLEARISELEKSQSLTQLAHQYPDLGVDLEDVEMDHEFLAKEEAEAEQRAAEEGAAGAEGYSWRKRAIKTLHSLNGISSRRRGSYGDIVDWRWKFLVVMNGRSNLRRHLQWRSKFLEPFCNELAIQIFYPLGDIRFGRHGLTWSAVPCMFTKINLGGEESEQSLPSWISDHLGTKSYIDETSQSPSSPPPNSPKMDTSSLTKEGNVMTQAELDKLGSTYSFPSGIRLRIPGDGETILSARQGEVAFYEAAFQAGLRLPIHPTIREILVHYKICPAQCLYSLSPLPDSGWFYFKARPDKNLLRGSLSNVKGWKTRFFFASGDEWEFFSGTAASNTLRVPRSWGTPGKSCNKLPTLSEVDAKRTEAILGKIEPGGYFEVSKVLGSRTFDKYFAVGCTALSTSGGDNTTSGDEGEFVTREDSVEYLGVIRRDIGRVIRRALPGIPDKTLLRWLGGKVKDPFTNLLSGTSGSNSDLGSVYISDSELPPELRSDAMSARAGAPAFGEKTGGKAKAEKATKVTTAKPPTKGIVIQEKRTREGVPVVEIGGPDSSKGKEATPTPGAQKIQVKPRGDQCQGPAAGAGTSSPGGDVGSESMSDASVARRLLTGVIPASDKEEVDRLPENDLIAKSFHALGQVVVFASSLAIRSQEHLHEIDFQMARADSAKLELAKELAIEDFKASGEFKVAVTDSAATYFSEGFEFCKRQLLHQFPNLGVDVANMAMDPSFAEEEEAMKEGEDPVSGVAPNV